ncbi:hypothetical protein GCM10011490_16030 [Pseudoclavibacter endophyticus]|uniref:hypothetical protein n=1 Tax=Pseudoclavibacter endophyticus TaxID=1778590 RepID=UPI0016664914|nr:hypothetical protein [Pseudoclavibacter endophyticus]GGA66165.1 hypothetical protein GCM10011490_16030 [Pseudoclavibacter endophyticus]
MSRRRLQRPLRSHAGDLDELVALASSASVTTAAGVDPDRVRTNAGTTLGSALAGLQRRLVDAPPRPAVVRVWWAGLSDDARGVLIGHAALTVGNLDGIPWPARVDANHRTLAAHIARREGARRGGLRRLSHRRETRAELLAQRLDALSSGPGLVSRAGRLRFLLAFDPERNAIVEYVGHGIAETDDPFASPIAPGVEAVAVFVPGNDADLLQFEAKAHTMSELVHAGAPGTTGLIVWQGSTFPRGPLGLGSAAAARLGRRFGAFVNAVPRAPGVRFVAFGFSFGGSVVGTAMRLGMRVDAVMHVASAGLGPGVRSLADYPAAGRVPHASLLAPGDVDVAPYLGIDLPRGPHGLGHGADPTTAPGVVRLETGFERHVPRGGDRTAGRAAGILRGHVTLLEHWGTTAKHAMRVVLIGGEAELAAPRTRLERVCERLGLPWSPLQRPGYVPRFTTFQGGPDGHGPAERDARAQANG